MRLEDLQDEFRHQTVWVLGSGPSLNFVDPNFFADKVVIATNFAGKVLGIEPEIAFSHYHKNARELSEVSGIVVTLARDTVTQQAWTGPLPDNVVLVHKLSYEPPGSSWNPLTTHRPDTIAYGSSSLHGAMHLGAYMGAGSIVLVGADCGTIDGEHRVAGYPDGHKLWSLYDKHHQLMKKYLEQEYGTMVYSLNPFINFNLEGHAFRGPNA